MVEDEYFNNLHEDELKILQGQIKVLKMQLEYSREWAEKMRHRAHGAEKSLDVWRNRARRIIEHLDGAKLVNRHRIRGIIMGGHDD